MWYVVWGEGILSRWMRVGVVDRWRDLFRYHYDMDDLPSISSRGDDKSKRAVIHLIHSRIGWLLGQKVDGEERREEDGWAQTV